MKNREFTTMEHLQMETSASYGAVVKYGDHVIRTDLNWHNTFTAEVYEFIETPEETGLGDIECRLSLIAKAEEPFKDSGHAIAWGLNQIK